MAYEIRLKSDEEILAELKLIDPAMKLCRAGSQTLVMDTPTELGEAQKLAILALELRVVGASDEKVEK